MSFQTVESTSEKDFGIGNSTGWPIELSLASPAVVVGPA